ncbi:MAG: hypothetical protein J6J31_08405 [Thermoguttaceae bacterium]|nr:hypothetical protein [Thermoguttaceae bacterium]
MRAKDMLLIDLLSGPKTQFKTMGPFEYTWDKIQCQVLLENIMHAASLSCTLFIGNINYEKYSENGILNFVLLDGLGRITTFILLFEALAREIEKRSINLELDCAETLRNSYIFTQTAPKKLKLILTPDEQPTLEAILNNRPFDDMKISQNLKENFEFFQKSINKMDLKELNVLYDTICGIQIIEVISEENDNDLNLPFDRPIHQQPEDEIIRCALNNEDESFFTNCNIKAFYFQEEWCDIDHWKNMLVKVVETLFNTAPEILRQLTADKKVKYLHNQCKDKSKWEKIGPGIYLRHHSSTMGKIQILKELFSYYNIDYSELKFKIVRKPMS